MLNRRTVPGTILSFLLVYSLVFRQLRPKVIIKEDCSGPGGNNMQTLLLIQSPQVEVPGITVVSRDQWRDEEVAHTLGLLEVIGRANIPSGASLYFSARDCLRPKLYAARTCTSDCPRQE